MIRIYGNTDADAYAQVVTIEDEWFCEHIENFLRDDFYVFLAGESLKRDRELITAKAGYKISRADTALQALRNHLQQTVADIMAQGVINYLKAVQINKQQRHPFAIPVCRGQSLFQAVADQVARICQAADQKGDIVLYW